MAGTQYFWRKMGYIIRLRLALFTTRLTHIALSRKLLETFQLLPFSRFQYVCVPLFSGVDIVEIDLGLVVVVSVGGDYETPVVVLIYALHGSREGPSARCAKKE